MGKALTRLERYAAMRGERPELDAENLDLEETSSALYAALEADLSGLGWPSNTKVRLDTAFEMLDELITIAERG